jgi:hypothetical protein
MFPLPKAHKVKINLFPLPKAHKVTACKVVCMLNLGTRRSLALDSGTGRFIFREESQCPLDGRLCESQSRSGPPRSQSFC